MTALGTRTRGWVETQLDVVLEPVGNTHPPLTDLVELALRHNPRRAHLLVSTVLGKHVPADPRIVHGTGLSLGRLVGHRLNGQPAVVLGFAETATGLGHCVAEQLGAWYLHSTRRNVVGARPLAGFEEEHSHATSHRLLPDDPAPLFGPDVLVLVDDELSTGRTAMNTIAELHSIVPRRRYVLAALVDVRPAADQATLLRFAGDLGVEIDVVALARGRVSWPADFTQRAADVVAAGPAPDPVIAARGSLSELRGLWPAGVRETGRHGFDPRDAAAARCAAADVARHLAADLGRTLVLGTEELMYAPTLLGVALADLGVDVRVSSTTRSPVHVVERPGYPIRAVLTFPAHDGTDAAARFAYNVCAGQYDDVVVVVDEAADTAALRDGLLERLRQVCARVRLVVLPTTVPLPEPLAGPDFGSYAPDEVSWLLTDLSDVSLEAPTEEREEAIQSGGAHYAESLPVEYQPDAEYRHLFEQALEQSAVRIAHAVGVVTEVVLNERGSDVVLASLARAGTPVGVLMRRWAAFRHGVDLPHHAVSIVRGRGMDTTALQWLARRYRPRDIAFVDGWTGRAIARELDAALARAGGGFDPALAVLADPGSCVRTFGTREDFLVPSACLNSTVSGLVSRTVLNTQILRAEQFHGAKFYRELASNDVSSRFLDAVSSRFAEVAGDVARDWPAVQSSEREPTWAGWAEVERLSAEYGIGDVTLVKPGVGETTRVLLRRVPWAVLIRTGAADELAHVLLLAQRRGVAVHEVEGLAYRCVGLIHPRFTRAATGVDGHAASR